MPGTDLGEDDVKNVSCWITFVKPDLATTLQEMREETIDYATDETNFGGLKLAQFFQDLAAGRVLWPKAWRPISPGQVYLKVVSEQDGLTYLQGLPDTDKRYINFSMRLNSRQPQPDSVPNNDEGQVLREIRDELHKKA
jgi:hypothetical protein